MPPGEPTRENRRILQTASEKSQPPGTVLHTIDRYFPLPWSAYVRLLSVKNELARRFYATEALREGWSVRQDEAVARYALEGLPNKVMASEYRTALPDEKELAYEIERTRAILQDRKRIALTSLASIRTKKSTKIKGHCMRKSRHICPLRSINSCQSETALICLRFYRWNTQWAVLLN